ncbi:MAG: hypothetical protein R2755_30285 [Acidimicrobiales bacterium]
MGPLRSLEADVAVLPEAARAPGRAAGSLLEPTAHWHWVGVNPQKGLAVTTFAAPSGVLAAEATGRWSIGVRSGGLTVLGVWSCPSGGGYAREVHRAVDAHVRWFHPDGDVIVAGDFNVDAAGALRRRSGDFRRLAERLHGLGLTSAYHLVRHEPYGAESRPTYYHHRNMGTCSTSTSASCRSRWWNGCVRWRWARSTTGWRPDTPITYRSSSNWREQELSGVRSW